MAALCVKHGFKAFESVFSPLVLCKVQGAMSYVGKNP